MAWQNAPSGFTNEVRKDFARKVRGTALQAYTLILQASPVDKGTFRANNNLTIGEPDYNYDLGKTTPGDTSILAQVNSNPFVKISIANGMPYGEVIEFGKFGDGPKTIGGFSSQAPAGVYAVTFNSLKEGAENGL